MVVSLTVMVVGFCIVLPLQLTLFKGYIFEPLKSIVPGRGVPLQ
jgi:hypothetical protein